MTYPYSRTPLSHVVLGLTLAVVITGAGNANHVAPAPHHSGPLHHAGSTARSSRPQPSLGWNGFPESRIGLAILLPTMSGKGAPAR